MSSLHIVFGLLSVRSMLSPLVVLCPCSLCRSGSPLFCSLFLWSLFVPFLLLRSACPVDVLSSCSQSVGFVVVSVSWSSVHPVSPLPAFPVLSSLLFFSLLLVRCASCSCLVVLLLCCRVFCVVFCLVGVRGGFCLLFFLCLLLKRVCKALQVPPCSPLSPPSSSLAVLLLSGYGSGL